MALVASVSAAPTPVRGSVSESSSKLPLRKIPGDYGLPLLGAIKDRLDYFYNPQGREQFFKSRQLKYNSTVFRANMPPGPFISSDPRVIVLLDSNSFSVLFDLSRVDKTDVFTGTFMPSTHLTGGHRVLSYLDPSEPKHEKLKRLLFFLLKSRSSAVIPEFHSCYTQAFQSLETELAKNGKATFGDINDQATFNFLARALYGTNPADTSLGSDGPSLVQKWVLFQLSPTLSLGLPKLLEDPILHSFRLPPFLVKGDYERLYEFFYESSSSVLDEAERLGVSRQEACHNLLFATCFNSFGGFKILLPSLVKWIGEAGAGLQARLAEEIRSAVSGGEVTVAAMEGMALVKSVVYETLRMEPPVALQYGKAKRDMVIESHENGFEVKKGEMLFGFQPFATRDPKIFESAEEFVGDRFVGEEGERLLKHVLWSNGFETDAPTVANKQCAGKDFVVFVARIFVVNIFLRYDSFQVQANKSTLGYDVTFTSLIKRASQQC